MSSFEIDPTAPEFARDVLQALLENADVVGTDEHGRHAICLSVGPALLDALAEFAAELEDLEEDDPAEDGDGREDDECDGLPPRTRFVSCVVNRRAWEAARRRRKRAGGRPRARACRESIAAAILRAG